jgi:ParB family chromosome partitioning protein
MAKEVGRIIVPVKDIVVVPGKNPRGNGPLPKIDDMANSLQETGQLQAILVRQADLHKNGHRKYLLIAGERRLEGAIKLGWETIEVKVVEGTDLECALMALIENGQREGMDPYAEAEAYAAIMEQYGLSQAQLAAKLSVSEPHISQRMKILRESIDAVRQAVQNKQISPTLARELAGLPGEQQTEYLQAILAKKAERGPEGRVTVAEIKTFVDQSKRKLKAQKDPDYALKDEEHLKERMDEVRKKAHLRNKDSLVEAYGLLLAKSRRAKNETSVIKVKQAAETLEYALGLRDSI